MATIHSVGSHAMVSFKKSKRKSSNGLLGHLVLCLYVCGQAQVMVLLKKRENLVSKENCDCPMRVLLTAMLRRDKLVFLVKYGHENVALFDKTLQYDSQLVVFNALTTGTVISRRAV